MDDYNERLHEALARSNRKTNYDLVVAMTPEALAQFMGEICMRETWKILRGGAAMSIKEWLAWLTEEAEHAST